MALSTLVDLRITTIKNTITWLFVEKISKISNLTVEVTRSVVVLKLQNYDFVLAKIIVKFVSKIEYTEK